MAAERELDPEPSRAPGQVPDLEQPEWDQVRTEAQAQVQAQIRTLKRAQALDRAHGAALRAFKAWLIAKLLAGEIDCLRFEGEPEPLTAPGLEELLARQEHDFHEVCDLSNRASVLLADHDRTEGLAPTDAYVDAAEEGAAETERTSRRIAQLALGVIAGLTPTKRSECIDGVAVAVLSWPQGSESAVSLIEDGIELFGSKKRELRVEFGGLIRRMLIDGNVAVRCGEIELRVNSDESFHLSTPVREQAWDSPVQVSDLARTTSKAFKSFGISRKQIRDTASVA